MANLPSVRRILREDIKEAPDWISQLLLPLNKVLQSQYSALDGNLTFQQNISAQIKSLTFTTGSTYPANFVPMSFPVTLKTTPMGCLKLSCISIPYETITNAVDIDWVNSNGTLYINNVTGLSPSTQYQLTVLVV
jgi:hypothetical protein